jgi:hypothetical protein
MVSEIQYRRMPPLRGPNGRDLRADLVTRTVDSWQSSGGWTVPRTIRVAGGALLVLVALNMLIVFGVLM